MRKVLIRYWRKIQRSKRFALFAKFMMWFIDTEIFNCCMDFFEMNKQRIQRNTKLFADEKSRAVYVNAIRYQCTLKRKYLSCTSRAAEKYFDSEIIRFHENEIIMDCGAYTGDTVLLLEKKWSNWGKPDAGLKIICWEPDRFNASKLEKTLSGMTERHEDFSYRIIKKAVWKEKAKLSFDLGADYASRIADGGYKWKRIL